MNGVAFEVRERVTSIIDGEPVGVSRQGVDFPIINPASEAENGVLREADAQEVDAAVRSARKAFETGPWPRMGADERKAIFRAMHEGLHKHREELEFLDSLNTGVPISQVRAMHVARAAYNFEFFGEVLSQESGEVYTQNPNYLTYVTREPVGRGRDDGALGTRRFRWPQCAWPPASPSAIPVCSNPPSTPRTRWSAWLKSSTKPGCRRAS